MEPEDTEAATTLLNKLDEGDIPRYLKEKSYSNPEKIVFLGVDASSKKDSNLIDFHFPISELPIELRERIAKFAARNNLSACLFFLFDNGLITEKCKIELRLNLQISLKHTLWVINQIKNCNTPEKISVLKERAMRGNLGINPWNDPVAFKLWKNQSDLNSQDLALYVANSHENAKKLYNTLAAFSTAKTEMIEFSELKEVDPRKLTPEIKAAVVGYYEIRNQFLGDALLKKREYRAKVNKCLKCAAYGGLGCYFCSSFLVCPSISIAGCILMEPALILTGVFSTAGSAIIGFFPAAWAGLRINDKDIDMYSLVSRKPNIEPYIEDAYSKLLRAQSEVEEHPLVAFENYF